ncbi:MAG: hypothetical protein LBD01_05890 [Puniceicoccales bacterium]|nr:hypothetical protein [Puniceicoccales bacterium]
MSSVDVEVPQTDREQVEFIVGFGQPVTIHCGRRIVTFHLADAMLDHYAQSGKQGVPLLWRGFLGTLFLCLLNVRSSICMPKSLLPSRLLANAYFSTRLMKHPLRFALDLSRDYGLKGRVLGNEAGIVQW